ncbi:hypothetical protein AAHC03_04705 [Spirometra sp. Aus1]
MGSRNYNISTSGRGRSRLHSRVKTAQAALPASTTRNEDIELAVLVSPPELVSRCTSKQPFPIESDTRTRVFVYLVSLALSLAALSILKLHKLLEWLLVDTDVTSFHGSISDLKSKSSVIAEILKAAALRYKKSLNSPARAVDAEKVHAQDLMSGSVVPTGAAAANVTAPAFFTAHAATAKDHRCLCSHPSSSAVLQSPTTSPGKRSDATNALGFCHHWPSASQPCILCYLASSGEYSLPFSDRRQRSYSESKCGHQPQSDTYSWPSPSRLNAGICRSQVSVGHTPGSLSVELCSANISRLSGLELAAAISKQKAKHRRFVSCGEDRCDESPGIAASPQRPNDVPVASTEEPLSARIVAEASSGTTSPTTESSSTTPSSPFSRRHNGSPKLVACVAPTSQHITQQPTTTLCGHQRSRLRTDCYPKKLRAPLGDGNLQTVEEVEEHLETKTFSEEAAEATATTEAGSPGFLITTTSATVLARAAVLAVHRKIFESRGVGVSVERVEACTSPIPSASPLSLGSPVTSVPQKLITNTFGKNDDSVDSVSEVEDLELDDDGVWFSHDLLPPTTHRIFSPNFYDVEGEEDEEVCGIGIFSPILNQQDGSCSSLTSQPSGHLYSGEEEEANFSDLVALTTSISDDLMKLETGCHELIYRVQANRIELDSVQDRLGYVWNNKDILADLNSGDVYSNPQEASLPERSLIGPAYMEDSFTSFASSTSRSMIRYTPLGRSFISDSEETPRNSGEGVDGCCCSCHQPHASAATPSAPLNLTTEWPATDSEETVLVSDNTGDGSAQISFETKTIQSVISDGVTRQSPGSDSFFNPNVSFEDEDAVQWCESRPLICQKL